ncbi:VENN motif pre-toxin domain-containing protein [Uruburuella testudinis]|uniref:VENN motif pre-toxin domain-containing protein n=1 Tax=Uruburuella testudinis TaxID=1282863 RepID=A0ABY4DNX2_9NEIS|nr:VENN motif pre-toxin domain-containing protein [Uruburuella testudinis]UOO80749.1 VENN motif pre-toxin domain-containing protein [Uruburuella testudinis]
MQLKGGAIASTAAKENNGLTANALTFEDIQNHSSYKATNVGLSGGYGGGLSSSEAFQQSPLGQASAVAGQSISQGPGYSPTLPQYDSGSDSSMTRATLSAGRLNIGGQETTTQALGINSDTETAHQKLAALPDIQQILHNQQAAASATADITSAVRTFSGNMAAEAQKAQQQAYEQLQTAIKNNDAAQIEAAVQQYNQAQQSAKDWGIGGSKARALNAVSTVVTGALGGQNGLQTAANTLSPYAAETIGQTFGQNGSNPNETAQLLSHALLAGIVAAGNGGDFGAGAAAGAGAEATAKVITEVLAGKEAANHPNLLSEEQKTTIRDLSAAVGAFVGGIGGDSGLNAQIGGVVAQNAVENNWLHSQTAKQKGWLSKTEIALLDRLTKQSGAHSIEYFIQEEQKIRQSNMSHAIKEKALANLKREYEADSRKMEAAAAKLPKGSEERGLLYTIASKMQGIVSVLPSYDRSEFLRAEQRDWLPTSNLVIHNGDTGFVKVQQQWAVEDGKTLEEARFQTEMTAGGKMANIRSSKPQSILPIRNDQPVQVSAKGSIGKDYFYDVNQTAKINSPRTHTLIADRVNAKIAKDGKNRPNNTLADSHAEIGVIQQAYNAGKTKNASMSMEVIGKDVCSYCKGDIAVAAEIAGLKTLTIKAIDNLTGKTKSYYWQPGMKSIKEKK